MTPTCFRFRHTEGYAAMVGADHFLSADVRPDCLDPHLDAWFDQVFDSANIEKISTALPASDQSDRSCPSGEMPVVK